MAYPKRFNRRALADRSFLKFEFPQPEGNPVELFLPMLENCDISESRKSNLASYDIMGRNNTIYTYLGSKSKSISLKFNITLLNILDYISSEGLSELFLPSFRKYTITREERRKDFVGPQRVVTKELFPHSKAHRDYYLNKAGISTKKTDRLLDSTFNFLVNSLAIPEDTSNPEEFKDLNTTLDLMIYWINLVRASVINNSQDTTLGCPIVRITHGPLYNNIPCVVENHSIRIIKESGYDVQTLLPKQVEVSMSLSEVRVGNFEKFQTGKITDGDNNVGWEAILDENNMDPYNGEIGIAGIN